MRVVLLSHEYPPFIYGGIGTFVHSLSIGLSRIGAEVIVISGYPFSPSAHNGKKIEKFEKNDKITIYRFPFPDTSPRQMWFQIFNSKKIYDIVKTVNPDIIHGQCGSTFPASIRLKSIAPILVTFHHSPKIELMLSMLSIRRGGSLGDIKTYSLGYPAYSLTYRKEIKSTSMSVSVSKSLKRELLNEIGWKYQDKIKEIHNGVDTTQLEREYNILQNQEEIAGNDILFAGRLFWRKGALEIIKIARLMKYRKLKSKIIVHGEGPLLHEIKKAINNHKLKNIDIRGFTTRKQLMQSLKKSKFVLIPSLYEACPIILLESMCLGKIPLLYDLPYSQEFTENGKFGILAKDGCELVTKYSQLIEKNLNDLCNSIKKFALHNYDINQTASRYFELYKELYQ